MLRRLEDLDRLDREQGLGALPPAEGGVRRRRRRTVGPVLPGLLISGLIAGAVMLQSPDMTGYRMRQLVDHLTGNSEGSYAFVLTTTAGDPVSWDPCRPIHYLVNPEGAPEDWEDTVDSGVRAISEVSGFEFRYDGETDDRSFRQRAVDGQRPSPVLIAWADSSEVPDLEGTTAGIGGATPVRSGGRVRFVAGLVVLDTAAYDRMAATGDDQGQQLILAHELGHVLGLDHVDDSGELMNAEYVGQDGFGEGDAEGLQQLHDLPCG